MMRMVVVLPAPLAPTKPVIRPGRTANDTSCSTRVPAKSRTRPCTSIPFALPAQATLLTRPDPTGPPTGVLP